MKKLYSSILIILISFSGFAQSSEIKKGDRFFAERAYIDAADAYEQVTNKNQKVLQNLGDAYFYTNQLENAAEVYQLLFLRHKAEVESGYKLRFAHALMGVNKYEQADEYLSDYYGKDFNFDTFRRALDTTVAHVYNTNQVIDNAASSDFGISYYGDKVTFASTRNQERPIYPWNKRPSLDLYTADVDEDGKLSGIMLFPGDINTDSHESSATFSKDGLTMYFDRTNEKRVKNDDGDRVANIRIYSAKMVDGNWSNIEALPFTSDAYSTEHPSLSADGKKLYFASDMPGSLGSFDIYVVDVNQDGTFGTPRNLGSGVNTAQREQFPFISDQNILYFSSDGHQGFGNMDIFKSEGNFSESKNLGSTVNSGNDDFAFIIKEGQNQGWFASNRRGTDNLYNFTREDYKPPLVDIDDRETNIETGRQQLRDVGNIYFDFDKSTIKKESEVTLDKVVAIMKKYPTLEIEIGSHADARGPDNYNLALSERRAAATLEYLATHGIQRERLTSKGFGETMPLNDCTKPTGCTNEQYAKNRRSEFTIMN